MSSLDTSEPSKISDTYIEASIVCFPHNYIYSVNNVYATTGDVMSKEKQKELIIAELNSLEIKKNISSDKAMIVCPFHNDRTPSGGICLDVLEERAPLGWYRCFGCGTSVPWNDLAVKLGMKKIGKNLRKKSDDYIDPKAYKAHFFEEKEKKETLEEQITKLEFMPFQFDVWRGFNTNFLETLGAKYCYEDRLGEFYVWFPVNVLSKLRGFVKAVIKKKKGSTSYFNSSGKWSEKFGLIFFDEARHLAKTLGVNTVVLCEGPRDALRCLQAGIPAISVLGALNWSDAKREKLESASFDRVILFFDGDKAGRKANSRVKKNLKGYFEIKQISLWKKEPGADPFSCDISFLKLIKRNLV